MNAITKNIVVFLLVMIGVGAFFSLYSHQSIKAQKVGIETVVDQIANESIRKIAVDGEELNIDLKDGTKEVAYKEPNESLSTLLKNFTVDPEKIKKIEIDISDQKKSFWLNTIFSFLLPFLILGFIVFFTIRQLQGVNNRALTFGMSRARQFDPKEMKNKVTFQDVAGAAEAKQELHEVIEFLKDPKKFHDLGAKIPKGVLLIGAPGTGKTLLAKAVAGEADAPFFHVSGSEFIEMFVGVGASRVRDLFARAKKSAPCIIFVDELDAVGRQRGAGLGGSHDEREQTLNQILVEMDGFEPTDNVIVIAATNRPDVLDPALLRPGRFDRRVLIDLPTLIDREAILKVHAKNKPLTSDIDFSRIAQRTPGFSGADLANLLNEAAILVARRDGKEITIGDVFSSIEKVILGPERKGRLISDKEKKITAYHEGGHALISHLLPDSPPVQKISIISRGPAAGYTMNLPTEDRLFRTKKEFQAELAVLLGGYTAEKIIFGDVTTGASDDLKKATRLARKLVMHYGMSEGLGQRTYGEKDDLIFLGREITEQRDYSEKTAEAIDAEISGFINAAHATAQQTIDKYREKLENIVQLLLEKETLEKEEFDALFERTKEE
ncbi:ATP-dependent zinc metalloprotease FtsH [Candidatus Uhrbacteria bacterium]|nr:ATP-dependent zinc metalloprotease FtsH [Candidatus Uhrbacteria bacterium]